MPPAPALSVVIPVFNEADSIVALVAEVDAALGGRIEYEIIVVDDGSSDDTVGRLRRHAASGDGRPRIVRHGHNAGQSTAIRTGVRLARGTFVATLDGDGQNDPADIARLYERIATGDPDLALVCGNRTERRDSWIRRLSSRVANAVRGAILGDATPDTGCGLKVIRRATFMELPYFDHMHRFLPALVLRAGGRCESVAVNHRPRRHGQSKYGIGNRLWVGLVDLAGVAWLRRRNRHTEFEEVSPE
ncbi:MAG: glycosyltransferase family 2 protein [Gammaproteobacteria bacterium]|nr:glycosyltransferase family 2 protein [Gammaproteobacteria bacterium]